MPDTLFVDAVFAIPVTAVEQLANCGGSPARFAAHLRLRELMRVAATPRRFRDQIRYGTTLRVGAQILSDVLSNAVVPLHR